jgi:hypothetical protein
MRLHKKLQPTKALMNQAFEKEDVIFKKSDMEDFCKLFVIFLSAM